jgi:hypothetical protein
METRHSLRHCTDRNQEILRMPEAAGAKAIPGIWMPPQKAASREGVD